MIYELIDLTEKVLAVSQSKTKLLELALENGHRGKIQVQTSPHVYIVKETKQNVKSGRGRKKLQS